VVGWLVIFSLDSRFSSHSYKIKLSFYKQNFCLQKNDTISIQIRPYYFNLASFFFVNCGFSEVEIFFRNLISDNESFIFWHSSAEISIHFGEIAIYKSGRNISINWSILKRGCFQRYFFSPTISPNIDGFK
jgi:hypothetical protein